MALRAALSGPAAAPALPTVDTDLLSLASRSFLAFQLLQGSAHPSAQQKELLRRRVRDTTIRNALQLRGLAPLLASCDAQGIPVLLLKGLWLVHCVYRDPAARESGDIDLLFLPQDMARFTALAQSLGFEVPPGAGSLSEQAHTTNEFALRHPDSGLLLDVHWSLTNPASEAPVDEAVLWERSVLVDLGGVPCRTLDLEDHLLYLCFHAAAHHKFWAVGPRCLYDVAMVIRQPPRPIRWDQLVAHAHALGWSRSAWLVLSLVQQHLGVAAPSAAMSALHRETPEDGRVCDLALEAILTAQQQKSLYRHLARLLAPQPWSARAADLRHLLLPSRVQMTNQFGPSAKPTWQLHVRRWSSKLREWAPDFAGLLAGRAAERRDLARTRRIAGWLAAEDRP